MLDTKARKYFQPFFEKAADLFIAMGISANQTTVAAFFIGLGAAVSVYLGYNTIGVILLWVSGLLDVIDGTIARKTNSSSPVGTLMDILFDRMVEIAMLLSIAFLNQNLGIVIAIVLSSIIISITIFLTVGALAEKTGYKSFYYQAGLAERTEGFVMISLAVVFSSYREVVLVVFALMILFTAMQRFYEAIRVLKK